jgi:hypothetical protein
MGILMGTSFSGSFQFFTGFTHPTNANGSAAANAVANTVVNGNSLAWSGSAIQGVADIGGSYLAVANLIQRSSPPVATHTDGYVVLYKLDENGVASTLLGLLGCGDEESLSTIDQNFKANFIKFSPDSNWLAINWSNTQNNNEGGLCFYQRTANTDTWTFSKNAGLTVTEGAVGYTFGANGSWSPDSNTFVVTGSGVALAMEVANAFSINSPKIISSDGNISSAVYVGEKLVVKHVDPNFDTVFDLYAASGTTFTLNANNITVISNSTSYDLLPISDTRLLLYNNNDFGAPLLYDLTVGSGTFTLNSTGTKFLLLIH